MKKISILIAVVIALVLCCVFVACGGNDNPPIDDDGGDDPTSSITITFDSKGGSAVTPIVIDESTTSITAPTNPTRAGYVFAGWYLDSAYLQAFDFATLPTANITLYAKWTAEEIKITAFENGTINGYDINVIVEKDVSTLSIVSAVTLSGDATWKMYYDILGQTEIPTKIAASTSGSLLGGDNVFYIVATSQDGSQVQTYTLTIHRKHTVSVTFYHESSVVATSSVVTKEPIPQDKYPQSNIVTGYTITGWKDSKGNVWSDDSIVEGDMILNAEYSNSQATITLDTNGGEVSTTEQTVEFGSAYTLPVPTKEGCAFLYWFVSDGSARTNENGESLSNCDFVEDTTYYAKWQLNEYEVTVNTDNAFAGTVSGGGTFNYSAKVTLTAIINEGYTFLGWYDGDEKLSEDVSLTYTFRLGAKDVTYTARFIECPITLATNLDGTAGAVEGAKTTIVGKETTIKAVPFVGHNFVGWYNGDELLSDVAEYTFIMTGEKVTYTAKFEVKDEMKGFVFSANRIACSITGVTDKTVKNIVVPDYVTSISLGAFSECSSLEEITIPFVGQMRRTSTQDYQYPFGYIFGSTSFDGSVATTQRYIKSTTSAFKTATYYIPTTLKKVTVTGGNILYGAFSYCSTLTDITVPSNITVIEDLAFFSCSGLKSIAIPSGVETIGGSAFSRCTALESVTFDKDSKLTILKDEVFAYCSSLKELHLPSSIESIGTFLLTGCSSLESLTVPFVGATKIDENDKVRIPFGYIFGESGYDGGVGASQIYYTNRQDAEYIRPTYYIPATLTNVKVSGGLIPSHGFENCTTLKNIELSSSITLIEDSAFLDCTGLTSIVIPDGVKRIYSSTFYNCTALESVIFGENSQVSQIERYAFGYCSALESIVLPKRVSWIGGGYTFEGCYTLQKVYYGGSELDKDHISIHDNETYLVNATWYYYSEEEPTEAGNYWHYDSEGNVVEWTL